MKTIEEQIRETEENLQKLKIMQEEAKTQLGLDNFTPSNKSINKLFELMSDNKNKDYFGFKYTPERNYIQEYTPISFGDWTVETECDFGGGEGSGSTRYVVFKFTKKGEEPTYWYIPGYYESYNGSEFEYDDMYQCEPYEKMVIDYRPIK